LANLTVNEMAMFAKYNGDKDLINNELFWRECLMAYKETVIPLPMVDCAEARRKLSDMLNCPPGECGACCRYERVPVSREDVKRLGEVGATAAVLQDGQLYLMCKDGCQFLKDGACSVYAKRPDVCMQFPIQTPRDGVIDGKTPFKQVQYRLKCQPALEVIRAILRESLDGGEMVLLPDLSLIPKYVDPMDKILKEATREANRAN